MNVKLNNALPSFCTSLFTLFSLGVLATGINSGNVTKAGICSTGLNSPGNNPTQQISTFKTLNVRISLLKEKY